MKKEIWRNVPGYEGVRASSWGRLWFPPRIAKMPHGGSRLYQTAPTYGQMAYQNGKPLRMIVMMRHWGTLKVARLVCLAFKGESPPGKPFCLHLNENCADNRPGNLAWGTQKENLNMPMFRVRQSARTGVNSAHYQGQLRKLQALRDQI